MVYLDHFICAVGMIEYQRQLLFRLERCKVDDVNRIIFPDPVVVGFIRERDRQHALFFQVGFVNTREGFHKNNPDAQVARLHGRVLT